MFSKAHCVFDGPSIIMVQRYFACILTILLELDTAHVVSSNNEHYDRAQSLSYMSSMEYRADVISGNLADYILDGDLFLGFSSCAYNDRLDRVSESQQRHQRAFG